jgi:general secretion pathway protein C
MELRFSERHIVALNFILVAILAYFAALSVNDIVALRLSPAQAVGVSAASGARGTAAGPHPRSYYNAIVERDVFNLVPQEQSAPAVVVEDLHLNLIGVSQLSNGRPFAIIEDRGGQQSVYRLGEMIPNAGKLVQVDRDRVLIDRGGRRVALSLPKDTLPGPIVAPKPIAVPAAIDSGNSGSDASGDDFDPNITDLGDNRYQVPKATIDYSMNHLSEMFTQIRAIPSIQNGRTNGFALSEIEPGSVFDEMGLEEGDILRTVDGQQVTDPAQAMQMMNVLRNRNQLSVQVYRDGKPITLTYSIQ